ncbi:hypothetical protein AB0D13_27030 [Streptomyces sp. NPDC048430]|uniref:hypothetical protein n=1 Tax=Streptomyces sp. NPDC048430 TaxID=3155388 RepID=UPI00343EC8B3
MPEHVTPEAVEQLIEEVTARYAEQIIAERRAHTDPERLQDLKNKLETCAADRQALQDADHDEVAEIAARYTARLKEFKDQ